MTFIIFYILLSLNLWAKLWPSISCSNSLTLTRKAALVVKWQLMQRCSFPLQKQQISGDQKVWGQGAAAWESSCRLALRCDFPNHARFKEWDDGVQIIEWASSSSFSSMSFAWVRACWWSSFWHAVEKTEAKPIVTETLVLLGRLKIICSLKYNIPRGLHVFQSALKIIANCTTLAFRFDHARDLIEISLD